MQTYESPDGKYRVQRDDSGYMAAFRYGEPWRDLTGDNLVGVLLDRIDELSGQLSEALEYHGGYREASREELSRLRAALAARNVPKGDA